MSRNSSHEPTLLTANVSVRPASELTPEERAELGDIVSARPLQDTNYAAVVDVVATGNPVWLIYNRHPYDNIEAAPVLTDPMNMPAVFPAAIGSNFDTAKAITSLGDWKIGLAPSPSYDEFAALVNETKARGEVQCVPVWMQNLVKVLPGAADAAKPAPAG